MSVVVVVKEGSEALVQCNVTGLYDHFQWTHPKGHLMDQQEEGGRWRVEANGTLNFTEVSFSDRGRYTCLASRSDRDGDDGGGEEASYAVTVRVAHTHSGLGLFYVGVCLVTFAITLVFNIAKVCMVSTHLKETDKAINDFFRCEGMEKLQKAFEVAKRIPIITSDKAAELAKVTQFKTAELAKVTQFKTAELAKVTQCKTAELAKVTQFKTLELLRHIEELARSVPLPPLITSCRNVSEEEACPASVGAQEASQSLLTQPGEVAVNMKEASQSLITQPGEGAASMAGACQPDGASFHVQVSVHLDSPGGAEESRRSL